MIEFPGTICWNIWCLPNKYNLWTIDTITFFLHFSVFGSNSIISRTHPQTLNQKNVIIRDHSRSNVTNYGLRNEPKWECSRILILFSINFYGIPTSFRDFFFEIFDLIKSVEYFLILCQKTFLVTDACQLKCKGRWHIRNWQISRFLYSGWLC